MFFVLYLKNIMLLEWILIGVGLLELFIYLR